MLLVKLLNALYASWQHHVNERLLSAEKEVQNGIKCSWNNNVKKKITNEHPQHTNLEGNVCREVLEEEHLAIMACCTSGKYLHTCIHILSLPKAECIQYIIYIHMHAQKSRTVPLWGTVREKLPQSSR